jgi:hypothetical protein
MPVFKKMVDANPVKVASTKIEWQYDTLLERPITFHITDWITPNDQYAMSCHVLLSWNLICKNPRFNWHFTDIQG